MSITAKMSFNNVGQFGPHGCNYQGLVTVVSAAPESLGDAKGHHKSSNEYTVIELARPVDRDLFVGNKPFLKGPTYGEQRVNTLKIQIPYDAFEKLSVAAKTANRVLDLTEDGIKKVQACLTEGSGKTPVESFFVPAALTL